MVRQTTATPAPDYHPPEIRLEDSKQSGRERLKAFAGGLFIVVWIAALGLAIATLMTGHLIVFPRPEAGQKLPPPASNEPTDGEFAMTHLRYADCLCSRRVLSHIDPQMIPAA